MTSSNRHAVTLQSQPSTRRHCYRLVLLCGVLCCCAVLSFALYNPHAVFISTRAMPPAAALLEPLTDALQAAAGVGLKITVRQKGSEQQQVGLVKR